MQDKSLFGRFLSSIIFGGALGYSWGIRGVFVGYSWDIRMYRVCVGYVSGMYRESVEGDGARGGAGMPTTDEHGLARKHGAVINDNIDNLRPNQYPLGAKREIYQPRMSTDGHGNSDT